MGGGGFDPSRRSIFSASPRGLCHNSKAMSLAVQVLALVVFVSALRAQSLSLKKASPQGVKLLCQELAENPLLEWGLLPEFLGVRESTLAIGICSPEYRYWIWEEFDQQDFAELIKLKTAVAEKIAELKWMKKEQDAIKYREDAERMFRFRDDALKKKLGCWDAPRFKYSTPVALMVELKEAQSPSKMNLKYAVYMTSCFSMLFLILYLLWSKFIAYLEPWTLNFYEEFFLFLAQLIFLISNMRLWRRVREEALPNVIHFRQEVLLDVPERKDTEAQPMVAPETEISGEKNEEELKIAERKSDKKQKGVFSVDFLLSLQSKNVSFCDFNSFCI
jgi:hypothetical protein